MSERRLYLKYVIQLSCLFLLSFCLTGCGDVPVARGVTQSQANEIVAVLSHHGIYAIADKQVGVGDTYDVEVKKSYYTRAVDLLHSKGLPAKAQERFSDLIAQKGIIPDSREVEALRLDHALGVQLQEMLDNLPGVLSSRAIVRVNFLRGDSEPGASVVLQLREGADVDEAEIRDLIAKTVPGLGVESVHLSPHTRIEPGNNLLEEGAFNDDGTVVRVPLTSFFFRWRVPEEDYTGLTMSIVVFVFLVGIVGGMVGYWYGFIQREARSQFEGDIPKALHDVQSAALRLEGHSKELPPGGGS